MATVIRELIDGGFSPCNSPEEKVGKGRCRHMLSDSKNENMVLVHEARNSYSADIPSDPEEKENRSTVNKFIDSLPTIPTSTKENILKEILSVGGI